MTYRERVLGAVDASQERGWAAQQAILAAAKMAPQTAIYTLKELVSEGQLEWTIKRRGIGGGSGAAARLYRRRQTRTEAAA